MELYIHLPFCRQKCRYCDFASWAGLEDRMGFYVDLLLLEAKQQRTWMEGPAETVYLGGGTPSLLPPRQLLRLIGGLREIFGIAPGAEFTSEANPGTVTEEWLDTALEGGVNRLSLGVQAFQDPLLRMLGRIHRREEAEQSFRMARRAGFRNMSLDLMFGLPGQSEADWAESLEAALSLKPEHISAYGLIPEEGTPLMEDLEQGRLTLPETETERRMYDTLKKTLRKGGLLPYEVSNFAREGFACRHNLGYWRQVPYLGLGVSAASMVGLERKHGGLTCLRLSNPAGFADYENMVTKGAPAREETRVSPAEARFETLMLGLRLYEGISEAEFETMHGISLQAWRGDALFSLEKRGLLTHKRGRWALTDRGMDIQNAVLVELMD